MGALPKEVIILIVIVSSGCAVLLAWAFHTMYHGQKGTVDENAVVGEAAQQQAAYRREVVERHHADIAARNGRKWPTSNHYEV